jgi:ABC-2 type transport system ATP-binding protein
MLYFTKFQKSYANCPVLQIADLMIEPGVYWLKGVNGSGKSTLLKAISGILSFKGDILLNGNISVKKDPVEYRKLVNFAEAEPLFPEFLTGKEMVSLFAYAKNAPQNQEQYFIESMQMQNYIDKPLGTYSSGMLKKLSLVLAFIGNPKLILLDEPLITLDVESLEILYHWIAEAYKHRDTSFLLSSHQDMKQESLFSARELVVEMQTLKLNF